MPFIVGKWNIGDDGVMEMKNVVFPDWEGVLSYIHIPKTSEGIHYDVMGNHNTVGYIDCSSNNFGWVIAEYNKSEKGMYMVGSIRSTRIETADIVPSWNDVKKFLIAKTVPEKKIGDDLNCVKTICTSTLHGSCYWFMFKI